MKSKKIPKKGKKKKPADQGGLHVGSMQQIMVMLEQGYTSAECIKKVTLWRKEQGLSVTPSYINKLVSEGNRRLCQDFAKNKNEVIAIHVERYNKDILNLFKQIEKMMEMLKRMENPEDYPDEEPSGFDPKAYAILKQGITTNYYQVLAAMFSKEKVLQMHSKSFVIFINNRLNVNIKAHKENYNISKLNKEERLDFLKLMLKAKQNEFEVGSVILRNEEKQQVTTEDIEHVILDTKPANVEEITLIQDKTIQYPARTGRALYDVGQRLKETLELRALEELKRVGSTLAYDDERRLQELLAAKTNSK